MYVSSQRGIIEDPCVTTLSALLQGGHSWSKGGQEVARRSRGPASMDARLLHGNQTTMEGEDNVTVRVYSLLLNHSCLLCEWFS